MNVQVEVERWLDHVLGCERCEAWWLDRADQHRDGPCERGKPILERTEIVLEFEMPPVDDDEDDPPPPPIRPEST